MSDSAEVVIVGGGVMGCSIQHGLAEKGVHDSLLLEQNALASGSTSRSQAILRMHYSNEVTARLAWESLKIFKDFEEIVGSPSGYTQTGYLLIVPREDIQPMRQNLDMQKVVGINTVEVSREDLYTLCDMVETHENESYSWEPDSGYADPYLVTTGYASRSRQLGAHIKASTRVLSIDIVGGRVNGVVTDKGVVSTDTVVLATGPWSGPLLESVDSDIKLDTVRHQVVLLKHSNALRSSHPIIGDVTLDLSARPDVGGLTMIGVGEDENADPDSFNQGVDMPMVEKTMANMIRRIPSMESAQFIGGWSGLFTTTPDWHPVLDQIEGIKGLYCAVGFSGHGFKLSPMIGKVMSEIIVEGQSTSVDVSRLNASRFKTGNLLESNYRMQVLA